MEKIFDIRFLVPPILMLLSIFLFNPDRFLKLHEHSLIIVAPILSFIILSFGIIISSIVDRFISCFNLRSPNYDSSEKEKIKDLFFSEFHAGEKTSLSDDYKDSDAVELSCWLVLNNLSYKNDEFVRQIHKRWNWAISNYNMLAGLVFALLYVLIFSSLCMNIYNISNYTFLWFFVNLLLMAVFLINGEYARKSVLKIDRILARNYDQILKNNS